jgi:hypothetical protein
MKSKTWKPKKHSHKYKDFRQLCAYCINQYGDETPEKAAYRITDEDWMHPDSDHADSKSILKACRAAWAGAKKDVQEIGEKQEEKRLTEPEKMDKALDYIKANVVYDTFRNSYLNKTTLEETSPVDAFISYNYLVSDKLYIPKLFFDYAFESVQVPKVDPLKEWASNLPPWNGKVDYIKKLCSFIPARNPLQMELYLKAWLIRSYIQAINPHNKSAVEITNRHFLILQSNMEGSGKTGFLQWLSPFPEWVKISGIEQGKDGKRVMANYMIVVDDEMHGITQFKETAAFKSLISMSKVDVRLPYARKDSYLPRVASFCGSCNSARLFPVGEQNTRFLCVPLLDKMFDYRGYMKATDKNKLWGQVKAMSDTDWLDKNDKTIRELRTETNKEFERETLEEYLLDTYFVQLPESRKEVMQTGDVIQKIREMEEYRNANINMNVMGSILTKKFGDRVNGYIRGVRSRGYKIEFLAKSPTDTPTQVIHRKPLFSTKIGKSNMTRNGKAILKKRKK